VGPQGIGATSLTMDEEFARGRGSPRERIWERNTRPLKGKRGAVSLAEREQGEKDSNLPRKDCGLVKGHKKRRKVGIAKQRADQRKRKNRCRGKKSKRGRSHASKRLTKRAHRRRWEGGGEKLTRRHVAGSRSTLHGVKGAPKVRARGCWSFITMSSHTRTRGQGKKMKKREAHDTSKKRWYAKHCLTTGTRFKKKKKKGTRRGRLTLVLGANATCQERDWGTVRSHTHFPAGVIGRREQKGGGTVKKGAAEGAAGKKKVVSNPGPIQRSPKHEGGGR